MGQIGGNQGEKEERKKKTMTERDEEKGREIGEEKKEGITDGGELGKHGSHNRW